MALGLERSRIMLPRVQALSKATQAEGAVRGSMIA